MKSKVIRPALRAVAVTVALFVSLPAAAQQAPFTEGVHYHLLREAQPVQTGEQIEVVEMFWYQCPHCYDLEPYITRWQQRKPDNAEFVAVPAILSDRWAFAAKIYYTLQALGRAEELHADVFNAIHRDKRGLNSLQQFADWGAAHGIDRASLKATANSFAVQNKINFARVMSRKYGITGVPAVIVDGRYRTSVSLAGGRAELLEVIDHLVELAAAKRAEL